MTNRTLGGWLVHVMRAADGALSMEEALHVIMDSMKEFFPCQSVAVILIDDDTKELRIKISRQISYTFSKKFHRDGPSPTAERAVLEQQPLLLNNVDRTDVRYAELKLEHDFTSAVLAPIVINQRGIGYVFADRNDGGEFDESDQLHLQVLGYLIGQIIEKFDLIKTSKKLSQIDDASKALQYKAFVPALATELERARTHAYPVVLALIAVDAFRKYIETYGIDEAHALLAEVVAVTRRRIRDMDILARFGADEFVLCLSGMIEGEAKAKLEDIRNDVHEGLVGHGELPVSLTIGALSLADPHLLGRSLQDILAALGRQLVEAKDNKLGNVAITAMN